MASSTDRRIQNRDIWILAGITFVSLGCYLVFSRIYHSIGFPLDDAWIHQTFARNLATRGEWSFLPGKLSGGSTSPLWSALLAIGFWLRLAPYAWTYLLGAAALWGLAVLAENTMREIIPSYDPNFPWIGTALALEWHLVWAAGSGMETLAYSLLVTVVLVMIMLRSKKYLAMGAIIGLAVWIRPDGIILVGAAALAVFLNGKAWLEKFKNIASLAISTGSLSAVYLFFNLAVSQSPLPNTFYAKQAEYAVYLRLPFLQRLWGEALQPLVGIGAILITGLIMMLILAIRNRNWGVLIAMLWLVGFLSLYAWRLPVTYQHGRYVIPVIPIYLLLGLAGLVKFKMEYANRWRWVVPFFWKMTAALVLIIFWVRGAIAYAQDVALIETEMVDTAKWVALNIPADKLIAVHDIGAMGYFGKHTLVDLAGLVSPDVIQYLRDENKLAEYLNLRGANYLVAFPDWYVHLTANLTPVFSTGAIYSPKFGGQNMTVYQWPVP
jgi:hypothetical protein